MSTNEGEVIETRDYEAEAKQHGWVPKEDWKGPPERWADAQAFVARGEQIFSYVQAKNRKLVETVGTLQREITEVKDATRGVTDFYEKALAREKKDREVLIAQLETDRAKAITDGDGQTFTIKDRKIRELQEEQAARPTEQEPAFVQAWKTDNPWYVSDPTLQGIADGLSSVLKRENPGLLGRAFLDKLTERVQTEVPHKFKNARRDEAITESHDAKKVQNSKAKTYDNLPADAKAACDKYVRQIKDFTREKYLSQYDWSEQ